MPFLKHGIGGDCDGQPDDESADDEAHGVSEKWIRDRLNSGAKKLSGGVVVKTGTMAAESRAHAKRAKELMAETQGANKRGDSATANKKAPQMHKRIFAARESDRIATRLSRGK